MPAPKQSKHDAESSVIQCAITQVVNLLKSTLPNAVAVLGLISLMTVAGLIYALYMLLQNGQK